MRPGAYHRAGEPCADHIKVLMRLCIRLNIVTSSGQFLCRFVISAGKFPEVMQQQSLWEFEVRYCQVGHTRPPNFHIACLDSVVTMHISCRNLNFSLQSFTWICQNWEDYILLMCGAALGKCNKYMIDYCPFASTFYLMRFNIPFNRALMLCITTSLNIATILTISKSLTL